ncbi:MAG: hypothetical protein ABL951_02685 [Alphaproteobacteria bacterium]
MTDLQLLNAILLLKCINADEFAAAPFGDGALWADPTDIVFWGAYQRDPIGFYIHAGDADRKALFGIIQKRLTTGENND